MQTLIASTPLPLPCIAPHRHLRRKAGPLRVQIRPGQFSRVVISHGRALGTTQGEARCQMDSKRLYDVGKSAKDLPIEKTKSFLQHLNSLTLAAATESSLLRSRVSQLHVSIAFPVFPTSLAQAHAIRPLSTTTVLCHSSHLLLRPVLKIKVAGLHLHVGTSSTRTTTRNRDLLDPQVRISCRHRRLRNRIVLRSKTPFSASIHRAHRPLRRHVKALH